MIFLDLLREMASTAIAPTTAALAIAAIGLNIHFGYTGLLNMGQAGFMLLGAYGFAVSVQAGLGFVPALIVALLVVLVYSFILGVPTLKLRGDYLAIVTISAAEIIRMVGRSSVLGPITNGSNGIPGDRYRDPFNGLSFFGDGQTTILWWTYDNTGVSGWWVRAVAWAVVAVLLVLVWLLIRSPWGRVLKGIREDEDAVRSLGKSAFSFKMQALILGGLIGGIAGIVYVMPSSVQPDALGRSMTFFIWTALLLGGAATIFGPVLGAILFFVVRIFIQGVTRLIVPEGVWSGQQTEQFSWILIGIALMLLVIFRPQGILGNKKELSFNV
ncbi:ABC-type branched-chain amino acid transport system, permease component [Microbacterium testaceum StLB037]|uniref:ABC-type branched-chain amino acid transport system, permease component n=1 Tax=Microbacterium testaceum (strain StLB037) TaxID=979556 RepID=E8NDU5_MICTS|nr:branched-chain amino acid ABC transporter permease [Microbacterium testaceum]BAJ73771.1 ABC-type branched-chain amino acid transport system, permease component [Microbacterium testaceum StLB037]